MVEAAGSGYEELDEPDHLQAAQSGGTAEQRWVHGSAEEFFEQTLRHLYRRPVGPQGRGHYRWAADWWRTPEAVARVDALWRAWETLRRDGGLGMSIWWRDHADHQMTVLLSPEGPFASSRSETGPDEPLPHERPPAVLFPDERRPTTARFAGPDGLVTVGVQAQETVGSTDT